MRARGIDPGDTIGWCDIERESASVFRFVACGTWEASSVGRSGPMPAGWTSPDGIDVYAIETPEEMHHNDVVGAFRAAEAALNLGTSRKGVASAAFDPGCARIMQKVRNLLETRSLAERIACSLAATGARVVEPTAAECRRALGVKFGAQRGKGVKLTVDQQIAQIIPIYIRDWPKRSNPHVRDAAAAAMWALGSASLAIGTEIDTISILAQRGAPCPREDCTFARCTDVAHWGIA